MSIQAPQGILNIPNATLRVGKLAVDEVVGADTILNTVARNTILLVDGEEYTENKNWSLKLPNAWAGEFECNTASAGNFSEFNFYNEGASSNAQGYNLTFNDTTAELRYDGTLLTSGTLPSTVVNTYRKVRLMFERTILSVTVDGTLIFTHDDTGGPRPRVYSTTAGGFLNFFTDGGAIDNLKIVNEKWISDGTSNIAYVGGGEVAVGKALAFNRVSNVSQIKVDANVVTEYTGPHDRPLREYPEMALTTTSETSSGYKGYKVSTSSQLTNYEGYHAFDKTGWETPASENNNAWVSGGSKYVAATGAPDTGAATTSYVGGTATGEYVQLQLPRKIKISKYDYTPRTHTGNDEGKSAPKTVKLLGSNNGSTWTLIKDITHLGTRPEEGVFYTAQVGATEYYDYIRFVATSTYSDGTSPTFTDVRLSQIRFYGHEEGSGSLDTTLKSVYNVPATTGTQLEVYYDGRETSSYSGSGTTVNDISPNTNNGTLNGGVGFDPTYKAFTFDGTDDYILTDITNPAGAFVHSVSTWIKADNMSSANDNITQIGSPGSDAHTKRLQFGLVDIDGVPGQINMGLSGSSVKFKTNLQVGIWYHLVYTYNGGAAGVGSTSYNMYVNGVSIPVGGGSGTGVLNLDANAKFAVGGHHLGYSGFHLDGSIANFRLYSKALNADQVKELYDYQKDYFLGSRSSVTLYKGHLGVGVAEPSGQLELAGDERIQEYPPGPMDDYETLIPGHGVFCASASSYFGTYYPWKAFDRNTTDTASEQSVWHTTADFTNATPGIYNAGASLGGYTGAWLKLKLPYSIKPSKVSIHPRTYNGAPPVADYDQNPKDFLILGSKDDNTWDVLSTQAGVVFGTTWKDFILSPGNNSYSYFAISCTKVKHGSYFAIADMKYFGTPGPTTLDKGSLSLTRSLDVPRISRYDVDTETPRPEKLVLDFDTTVNSSPTDISGKGNHGTLVGATYSPADKAFNFDGTDDYIDIPSVSGVGTGAWVHSKSFWFKLHSSTDPGILFLLGRNGSTKQIAVQSSSGQFQYFIYGCNSRVQVNGADWFPDLNRWYHCVTIFKNNETTAGGGVITGREMYIDGVKQTLVATGTQISLNLDSSEVRFGNQFNSNYLDYELSNPKLYSVALEPSEVKKLYNLGRTGRSMVISDTAVGIGKVPEAQLDVRGVANFGSRVGIGTNNPGSTLDVNGRLRTRYSSGYRSGTFNTTGLNMGSFSELGPDMPQIGWEIHLAFSCINNNSTVKIYGGYRTSGGVNSTASGTLYPISESSTWRWSEGNAHDYLSSSSAILAHETAAGHASYYAVIRIVNSHYTNADEGNGRLHLTSECIGTRNAVGATIWKSVGYLGFAAGDNGRFHTLRVLSSSGNIKGQWTGFPITT